MNFQFFTMFPYNNPYSHHVYFPGLYNTARRPTGTPAGSAARKTRNAVRHWNTITPERKLSTAAHAPLSGRCVMLPFSMGYIIRLLSLSFVGNLPVQFSYENETHPLRKHMLHGIGLRPISAQDGDFAHCDGATRCPQDI